MNQHLSLVSLVVADYDEAIAFFTRALNFELCEDTPLGGGKRWVVVRPPGGPGPACYWRGLTVRPKRRALVTRPGGGSSCSWKRIISSAIMRA
jgi:catechol 2,3-dioxygenase-like lactoylglutathione lyase family enzyme